MADHLALAAEFPAATREDWLKLVRAVLKDRPYETLIARTYDGLPIAPLSARAKDARAIAGRAPGAGWTLMQRVDHPDPAAANAEALHDLENGATGLMLVCAGSVSAYGFGIDGAPATLERALDGVQLDAGITIDFNVGADTRDTIRHFAAMVRKRGLDASAVDMRGSLNPIGGMAASGRSARPWSELAPYFAGLVGDLAKQGFRGPFAVGDGRIVHNAGGSEAQELAFVIASAVAYLRALDANGVALDAARGMIYFRMAADDDQFLTIAKFRGLRKLWARIEQACGLAPKPVYVSAETAWRMMTRRDPWVNMLRTTIAAFAAGVGGADAVCVLPFTMALGLPDRFARRIARNTQLLLLEESNLARVADPAAGSGAIEDLTGKLCGAAWALFQEIEAAGGIAAALEAGTIQEKIASARSAREKAVAIRKDALTGTSDYPDLAETPVKVLMPAPSPTLPREDGTEQGKISALPRIRLAEPFERLRDQSDAIQSATGTRPKVFLANLGTVADFNERATFARNFFAAGGIEAIQSDPTPGEKNQQRLAALGAAFRKSGSQIVCLCSSDEVYAREAAQAAKELTAAGARHIYLAGRPRELESALKAAGIGTFIFSGCDALATLKAAHDILSIGEGRR
jgi:methylmalonyl-CoA mutase